MADDENGNPHDNILTLLGEYKGKENFATAYAPILRELDNISLQDSLQYRISLLKKTPSDVVVYSDKKYSFFNDIGEELSDYLNFYWHKIDYAFCEKISKSSFDLIAESAKEITEKINLVLDFHNNLRKGTVRAVDENDARTAEYQQLIDNVALSIDNGKKNLEFIIPLFSVWGNAGTKIEQSVATREISVKAIEKSVQTLHEAVKAQGKSVTISLASEGFQKTFDTHKRRAFWSLIGGAVSASVLVVWGVVSQYIFSKSFQICSSYYWLDLVFCKLSDIEIRELFIGAVLIAIMYAFLRSYFANSHAESINRHRCNALQSYQVLHRTAEENEKEFILQKATEAIYEHVPTGFTKYHKDENNKSTDSMQMATLVAIARLMKGSGGGSGGTGSS